MCRRHVSAFNAVLMTIAASAPSPTPATSCCLGLGTPLNDSACRPFGCPVDLPLSRRRGCGTGRNERSEAEVSLLGEQSFTRQVEQPEHRTFREKCREQRRLRLAIPFGKRCRSRHLVDHPSNRVPESYGQLCPWPQPYRRDHRRVAKGSRYVLPATVYNVRQGHNGIHAVMARLCAHGMLHVR